MDIFNNINIGELGIVGLTIISLVAVVVSILRLGKSITDNEKSRDKDQSKILQDQLKILANQQSEFSKLNIIIAEILQKNSIQLEKATFSYSQLADVLSAFQNNLNKSEAETRREFNLILNHLQNHEKIMLEMSIVIAEMNKNISASTTQGQNCYLELKETIDKRIAEIQSNIKFIVEKQKEKEYRENVEKELSELFGGV